MVMINCKHFETMPKYTYNDHIFTSRMTISHCDGDIMDLFETGAKTFPKKLLTPYFQYFSLNTCIYKVKINKGVRFLFSNLQLLFSWVDQMVAFNPSFQNKIYALKGIVPQLFSVDQISYFG